MYQRQDLALELARQGMPFRDAYRQAADPERWQQGDPATSLQARTSPGGHADLRLEVIRERWQACNLETAPLPIDIDDISETAALD